MYFLYSMKCDLAILNVAAIVAVIKASNTYWVLNMNYIKATNII